MSEKLKVINVGELLEMELQDAPKEFSLKQLIAKLKAYRAALVSIDASEWHEEPAKYEHEMSLVNVAVDAPKALREGAFLVNEAYLFRVVALIPPSEGSGPPMIILGLVDGERGGDIENMTFLVTDSLLGGAA